MKNYFRYTVTSVAGGGARLPLGEGNFKIDWTLEDELKLGYNKTFPSKILFKGQAFDEIHALETSGDRCEWITLLIERNCGGTWNAIFNGRFSLNDASFNLDRCEVEIKVDKAQPDLCLDQNKAIELNLFDVITARPAARLYSNQITFETVTYTSEVIGAGSCTPDKVWSGAGTAAAGGWIDYYHYYATVPWTFIFKCIKETRWARQVIFQPSASPAPGAEWVLISDSAGVKKWAKPAVLYDCTEENLTATGGVINGFKKECKIANIDNTASAVIDNGLYLDDILQAFITEFCPGLTIKSEFFQINPDIVTGTNYVTGQDSKVRNIVFFQKSDVKRRNVSGNATKALLSFEKAMNILMGMFNARYDVIGTVLRVEHVSWFPKAAGLDLTLPKYTKYVQGKRQYSYNSAQVPEREEFKFMEASAGDFAGLPIRYEGACVTSEGRKNAKTISVDNVTTDVELIINNPAPDSTAVSDNGFCVVACNDDGLILSEPPIFDVSPKINNTLGWAHLHRDYHKYYRPLQRGYLNGVITSFFSVRPTKKGETLTVPLCCGDVFNPANFVTSPLGNGTVEKATFNFKNNTIALDLLYSAKIDAYIPPVAKNDIYNLETGSVTTLDVFANDEESNFIGAIYVLEIVAPPALGSAVIVAGPAIQYTAPATPGHVNIVYRVKDQNEIWSNNALISIEIL